MRIGIISRLFLISLSFFLLNSCYKINNTYLQKGKWSVKSFTINGGENNLLDDYYPGYDETSEVIITFSDQLNNENEGTMRMQYFTGGQLQEEAFGYWDMLEYDTISIRLQNLIDGHFKIEVNSATSMTMHTDHNYTGFFNVGDVTAVIEVELKDE